MTPTPDHPPPSPSFPDSPAPSITPTPNLLPSTPSGHDYVADYEAVMVSIHDLNGITKFIMGRGETPTEPDTSGYATQPEDVMDVLEVLKLMLDRMFDNLEQC